MIVSELDSVVIVTITIIHTAAHLAVKILCTAGIVIIVLLTIFTLQ